MWIRNRKILNRLGVYWGYFRWYWLNIYNFCLILLLVDETLKGEGELNNATFKKSCEEFPVTSGFMNKSNAAPFCLFSHLLSSPLLRNENVGMGFPLPQVHLALYENH